MDRPARLGRSRAGARTSASRASTRSWATSRARRSATRSSAREGDDVEIVSFGLLPGFAGRGLGGALLATVTQAAWDDGAERVWLHTCSLDSPAALPSYERRGFRRYDERIGR